MAQDDERCGECHSMNLKVVNIRDIFHPSHKGEPKSEQPVLVRKIEVQCRRCGWSTFILRRVE